VALLASLVKEGKVVKKGKAFHSDIVEGEGEEEI